MTAVTKSGTNSFRGDATAYWKPNSLQSHPIQVNCNCPAGQTGFNLGRMRDLSAHAGGPVLRDRLWFFAGVQDYEFTQPSLACTRRSNRPTTGTRARAR